MLEKIRKIPIVCLVLALTRLLIGKLKLTNNYLGAELKNKNGEVLRIFRNILADNRSENTNSCVFIVRFHFALLSHRANKLVSIIPMLLIAGFPGFVQKMYAVNPINGYWQGMYEWKSAKYLGDYKKSLVFRMMNNRAIKGSVRSFNILNCRLDEYVRTAYFIKEVII